MEASEMLESISPDLKKRIHYLAGKSEYDKESITIADLELAYEYARMNLRMLEESGVSMIELYVLER